MSRKRRYRISRRKKKLQMRKATRTRIKKYGRYFSPLGIQRVAKNLRKKVEQ